MTNSRRERARVGSELVEAGKVFIDDMVLSGFILPGEIGGVKWPCDDRGPKGMTVPGGGGPERGE